MSIAADRPKVGAAVFIMKDGKFIMGLRQGSHGAGTWGLAGGHLEFGETWEECVVRETREEFDLEVSNVRFLAVTNDVFIDEHKHYVTIFMIADWAGGEAKIMEPEFCSELKWFSYDDMPENILLPIKNLKLTWPDLKI